MVVQACFEKIREFANSQHLVLAHSTRKLSGKGMIVVNNSFLDNMDFPNKNCVCVYTWLAQFLPYDLVDLECSCNRACNRKARISACFSAFHLALVNSGHVL